MIFVTVGGQLPFDRLVHAVDRWALEHGRRDFFAQIGNSSNPPTHIPWKRFLSPNEFRNTARESEAIIAHAGMGSILTAFELGKPIVVMPRRAHLGEHRNDHQWATVKRLGGEVAISVAADEEGLRDHLERLQELPSPAERPSHEYERLLVFLRRTIEASD